MKMEYRAAPDSSMAVVSLPGRSWFRSKRSGTVSGNGTVDMDKQLQEGMALNDSQIANASESRQVLHSILLLPVRSSQDLRAYPFHCE
jgi:hypothetical protein